MRLTDEQRNVLDRALEGHNLVITGQAGTGKSFLVNEIVRCLKQNKKNVVVLCSSGLACTVYARGVAKTVHSHYGLQTADLPWQMVVERAKANALVCSRIREADCIVWDEVSMSSSRTLELANVMEHVVAEGENYGYAFGRKQIIVVGDFWQLKPVPDVFDSGEFSFTSHVFKTAFPHRYQLTRILRQGQEDIEFLGVLQELRLGHCSERSRHFIATLSRDLDSDISYDATHIFFKRLSSSLHNMNVLRSLPGEFIEVRAEIEGESTGVDMTAGCPAERVVYLKENCRVMLLWNKSNQLRNGSQGIFLKMETPNVANVRFPDVGVVKVGKETWLKRDRYGNVIGSITQIPLVTSYAITCHKSQGQTLPAAIVHCSQEFVSGLTYVALSRVKSADHLQVINFRPKFLRKPLEEVITECWSSAQNNLKENLSCCRQKKVNHPAIFFVSKDRADGTGDHGDESDLTPPPIQDEDLLKNIFEKESTLISLVEVNDILHEHIGEFAQPPNTLNVTDLLSSIKSKDAIVGTNGYDKNLLLDSLLLEYSLNDDTREIINAFIKVIWSHLFSIIDAHTADNVDDTITKITRQEFTAATGQLHVFFQSNEYKSYLHDFFGASKLSKVQTLVGSGIVLTLYTQFLAHLSDKVLQTCQDAEDSDQVPFNVWDMDDDGKGKVRYVGGWALRKVMEKCRRHVKQNMHSKEMGTLAKVQRNQLKAEIIQNELCAQYPTIASSTKYEGTLEATEFKQYRERGLINISDEAFEFFMSLEQSRVDALNKDRLRILGTDLIEVTIEEMKKNGSLQHQWKCCFSEENSIIMINQDVIVELYYEVVVRHLHMGANQFLRDFRHQYKIKKNAELRKRVLQRQQKKKEKQEMVNFEDIMKDTSTGKTTSHVLLCKYIEDNQYQALIRVYTKAQLQLLCRAYGVIFNSRSNKTILSSRLADAVNIVNSIPFISFLSPVQDPGSDTV